VTQNQFEMCGTDRVTCRILESPVQLFRFFGRELFWIHSFMCFF